MVFFFVLWVEGDQAVVLLLILACSCRRRLRRPKKTGKRVVFSIVDVTRLLAVRHKLIHAHTSSTRTQGRTHTHSRTHKRLECARVFDSSLCVWAFILFLLLFFRILYDSLDNFILLLLSFFITCYLFPCFFISFLISYN